MEKLLSLTTQKSFYVEISRARDRAELVTDDAKALREQLEAVTGERISALEGIGEMKRDDPVKAGEFSQLGEGRSIGQVEWMDRDGTTSPNVAREKQVPERERSRDMGFGL